MAPFRKTFSRPLKSGWKPAPSSSSEPIRPPTSTRARRRLDDPGDQPQQRRLAGAVAADEPDRLARLDGERHVLERLHVLRLGAAAEDEQLLQAARLVRVDAEAARDPVDPDLARLHAFRRYSGRAPDEPREHANEGGIGVRQLDPVEREPELRRALLRLDVEVPAGSRGGRRRSRPARRARRGRRRAASAFRCSRMSGPSHGSPVGDSLWNENDHSSTPAFSATRRDVSSSSSL